MKRISQWTMMATLAWVLACALPAWAADETGPRAREAGGPGRGLAERQAAQAPGHVEALDVPQDAGASHSWRGLAADRGPVLVATAGPPPKTIREAQALLAKLGYAPGTADGIWGQRSIRAYRAFLRDQGRPLSDRLTPEELRAMREIVKRRGGTASASEAPRRAPEARAAQARPDALHRAAWSGDVNGLKAALAAGADVNGRDDRGWTALMHAANRGYLLLVESLLTAQAKLDVRAPDGATALFMAALHGYTEIIELLMEAGANITLRGPKGWTASDAARKHYGDTAGARTNTSSAVLALLYGITLAEFRRFTGPFGPFGPGWILAENQFCHMYSRTAGEADTMTWSGACVDGKASGEGRLVRRNAGTLVYEYQGQMRDGRPHGSGAITFATGHRYTGDFRDGARHGQGTYIWPEGDRYTGGFRDDKMHGRGTYIWPNGRRDVGEWRNDEQWR